MCSLLCQFWVGDFLLSFARVGISNMQYEHLWWPIVTSAYALCVYFRRSFCDIMNTWVYREVKWVGKHLFGTLTVHLWCCIAGGSRSDILSDRGRSWDGLFSKFIDRLLSICLPRGNGKAPSRKEKKTSDRSTKKNKQVLVKQWNLHQPQSTKRKRKEN